MSVELSTARAAIAVTTIASAPTLAVLATLALRFLLAFAFLSSVIAVAFVAAVAMGVDVMGVIIVVQSITGVIPINITFRLSLNEFHTVFVL